MSNTFWKKDGKFIVDDSGKFILCDSCPCDDVVGYLYYGSFSETTVYPEPLSEKCANLVNKYRVLGRYILRAQVRRSGDDDNPYLMTVDGRAYLFKNVSEVSTIRYQLTGVIWWDLLIDHFTTPDRSFKLSAPAGAEAVSDEYNIDGLFHAYGSDKNGMSVTLQLNTFTKDDAPVTVSKIFFDDPTTDEMDISVDVSLPYTALYYKSDDWANPIGMQEGHISVGSVLPVSTEDNIITQIAVPETGPALTCRCEEDSIWLWTITFEDNGSETEVQGGVGLGAYGCSARVANIDII